MEINSSASFSLTVRVELEHKAGRLAALLSAVAKVGGVIGALVPEQALDEDDIVPSIFHPQVAEAVRQAAVRTGVARQFKKTPDALVG